MEVFRRQFRNGDPAQPLRHEARDALLRAHPHAGDSDWLDDVMIIISELVQNVSQHTHGPGELKVSLAAGTVRIEVGDASTITPHTRHPGPHRVGGRGLLLIEAIAQQWGVRTCPAGKAVWAHVPAAADLRRLSTI